MGTTNRRQPVSFDIPKSPDYKFLNITNFRGLDVSSNPFELATNTASDCLNVYVDETNTLTTRPRLELFANSPIDGDHIGTYSLHDGYLLHYNKYTRDENTHEIVSKTPTMWFFRNGKLEDKSVTGTIPTEKCTYFEQDNKTYLLDGTRYMVIEHNNLVDVEGYVPTTSIVKRDGTEYEVESANILSAYGNKKYYWDGVSELTFPTDAVDFDNNYYIDSYKNYPEMYDEITSLYANHRFNTDGSIFAYRTSTKEYHEIIIDHSTGTYTATGLGVYSGTGSNEFPKEGNAFWHTENKILYYYIKTKGEWKISAQFSFRTSGLSMQDVSPNGKYLLINDSADNYYIVKKSDDIDNYFNYYEIGQATLGWAWTMSNKALYIVKDCDDWTAKKWAIKRIVLDELDDEDDLSFEEIPTFIEHKWSDYEYGPEMHVTRNDKVFVLAQSIRSRVYKVGIVDEGVASTLRWTDFDYSALGVSYLDLTVDENLLGASGWAYDGDYYTYFVSPKYDDWSKVYSTKVRFKRLSPDYLASSEWYSIMKNVLILTDGDTQGTATTKYKRIRYYIWNTSIDPQLTVTSKISSDLVLDANEKKNIFLTSRLHTRFDNNYWLSAGNRYYRSRNNDPTYFPVTEYHDLGDSNEEITGFNLANDTTLIAYKKNKVYLIQPFTSSMDTTEYTITESKNTVGNTAIGAPVVTTLTEIPLQINNDGIYGLSQMSNVSATERIADLMSEPINERWLDIPDNYIANIKTFNRLYWTYVIIPREDNRNTCIYLLDNRTNSWYYWELPIVVVNAFAKDNRAEFVDIKGDIYYLTTTDIVNKAFESQLVTDYYDAGKQLIPWYWQSQILPLGTMNYSKRLVNTTFILTDTDAKDGYGLNYSFKVFRKLASSTPETEISGDLNLVRSYTHKTTISKFGFLQMKISNIEKRDADGNITADSYNNNKLRLVGLGLKYVLLEGLIK